MAQPEACQVQFTLTLQPDHWRRHDRAFWAQTLSAAIAEAAPNMMRVEAFELQDTLLIVRAVISRGAKAATKLLSDDEVFTRLRSRLVDLGAHAEISIVEDQE